MHVTYTSSLHTPYTASHHTRNIFSSHNKVPEVSEENQKLAELSMCPVQMCKTSIGPLAFVTCSPGLMIGFSLDVESVCTE